MGPDQIMTIPLGGKEATERVGRAFATHFLKPRMRDAERHEHAEIIAAYGPQDSGKTTLLRSIAQSLFNAKNEIFAWNRHQDEACNINGLNVRRVDMGDFTLGRLNQSTPTHVAAPRWGVHPYFPTRSPRHGRGLDLLEHGSLPYLGQASILVVGSVVSDVGSSMQSIARMDTMQQIFDLQAEPLGWFTPKFFTSGIDPRGHREKAAQVFEVTEVAVQQIIDRMPIGSHSTQRLMTVALLRDDVPARAAFANFRDAVNDLIPA